MGEHKTNTEETQAFSRLEQLTESFSNFNDIIEKLNASYNDLEIRFETLNKQLEDTNFKLRQALMENQKAQDFLQKLMESVPSGIIAYDLDGRITMMNKAACELLKINQNDDLEHGLKFEGDSHPELSAMNTIQSKTPAISEEKEIALISGEKIVVSLSTALLYDEDQQISGALEMYHDLSKIRGLEDEIMRVKTLAALGEMAATVAHEVRNPLGGILGFAALLRKDLGDEDPRSNMVDKIIKGVENLDHSVTSLLTYAQEVQPSMKTVSIKPFMDEIITNFKMTLTQNNETSNVDVIISPETLEWKFDPQHIRQCLLNLLLNAHQARPESSEIKLSVVADTKLNIMVSDTGSGIDDKVQEKLFTPFFTTRKAGTGLGLATVKKLVLLHKGEIKINSKVGRGTDITIEIPANLQ